MIVHIKQIINKARAGNYAVAAFNTSNLEITLAIVRAAVNKKSPVIISTSESAIEYSNVLTLFQLISNVANTIGKRVPIAIHLDHGHSLQTIKECLHIGYSSVHMDASEKDFSANIKLSHQAAQLAHTHGAWLQAELGSILGKEGLVKLKSGRIKMKDLLTRPEQAREFVAKTGLDTLAVSVGTIHGAFRGREKVDQPRLRKIRELTNKPLVLHGGSGLPAAAYCLAIKNGISVINIDTNLRLAFHQALLKNLVKSRELIDPRKILAPSVQAMQKEAEKMIDIFGSKNKA
ncbi:MAG: tagatose-bisphosphate aldolase [Parcubacteria group bacterium]|nr:MAG: tagatose-bisphosphate aldolase [Parcubacteria group bacterium]